MLRSFSGVLAPSGAPPDASRLRASLADEGEVRLLQAGPLTVAYTGAELPDYAAGDPVAVLDGTVYDLIGLDLPARTGPQAEACLARAYAEHGDSLLARLRGDFALLVFDPARQEGLLVRDQLGGRGAVWHSAGPRVTFATEFRPLLRALPQRPGPDPVVVSHWLAVSGMPGDRSLYAGVRRVEAGAALRLDRSGGEPFRYWSPQPSRPLKGEREEHVARLRSALEIAVERRAAAGERAAVLVSGGLDSGSVAALGAAAPPERRVRSAYSAVFPNHPSVDESELISELSDQVGLQSTRIKVYGGSILEGGLTYLRRFEVPPVSPNLFFWIPLQRRAAEDGVEVLLDGEGGDELFGLVAQLFADRVRRGRLLSTGSLVRRMPGSSGRLSRKAFAFYLRSYGLKGSVPYRLHEAARRRKDPAYYSPTWLRPEAAAAYAETYDQHAWKLIRGPRWFAHQLYRVSRGMGPALAYDHVRRRALLAGLEPRHPLIDVDVIELILRLPPELAYDHRYSRPLLRDAMAGLLPDPVRLRPTKSHFDAVFHESMAGPDLPAVRALLGRKDAEVGAYADLEQVRVLLAGPPEGTEERMWWALHLWRLVTAECWLLGQEGPDRVESLLAAPLEAPRVELTEPVPLRVAGC